MAMPAASHGDVSGKKVAVSMPSAGGRWIEEGELLKKLLLSEGCQVELLYTEEPGTEETEEEAPASSRQAANTLGLIRNGCDVLIVASETEDEELVLSLAEAKNQGIPVIAYDRLLMNTDAVSYYVSYDSYREGQLQSDYVAASLGLLSADRSKEHHVEFAAGDPEDYRSVYLFNGAYDTMKPFLDAGALSVPSGQVTFSQVAVEGGDADHAKARMERILQDNYSADLLLDAVICSTDKVAAGAAEASSSRREGKHQVIITGLGAEEEALKYVTEGKQSMTLYEERQREAVVAAALACSLLTGDASDANLIADSSWDFECRYDTASYDNGAGIVPSYLLEPIVITAGNVSEAAPGNAE